jgi:enoyl-CoA hydratase/carnithine racemase
MMCAVSDLRVQPLQHERSGVTGIAARLDAPRHRNALSLDTVEHLHRVLADDPVSTVLLGSTTSGIFSSGADLGADDRTRARLSDQLYACYELMVSRPGLVIAVVDGPAVGGGAQLTAAADLRIASAAACWRWVGPRHGLAVGAWILPELVGRSLALNLTLTGRWLHAQQAVRAGFISDLAADPWEAALDTAQALAEANPSALTAVKQVANRPGLLRRLAEERRRNRDAWTGRAPSPRAAAEESRRSRLTTGEQSGI